MRVLHLTGSPVSAFYADLSRLYAADCLEATAGVGEPVIAYVEPGGDWRFPAGLSRGAIAAAAPVPIAEAVQRVVALDLAAMVPQMFCVPGMTHYRALFDVLGVPYAGNRADVMALTADKAKAKAVVAAAGVRVPRGEVLRAGDEPTIEPPSVVKPVDADNSLGVTLVRGRAEYAEALGGAFEHAGAALVEEYVALGREVRCGVLERDGQLVCLPLEEYAVDGVRTPADKIVRAGDGDLALVAKEASKAWIVDPSDPITAPVWAAARACHAALGCRHYSLFDFRVDEAGDPWFLEASLYCSFARQSVLCVMAAAAGVPTRDLFRTVLSNLVSVSP